MVARAAGFVAELLESDEPLETAVAYAAKVLRAIERPRLAISGGSALSLVKPLREALGDHWAHVCVTFADERCVPFEDEASNRGQAFRSGALDGTADILPLYEDGESPDQACARFNAAFHERMQGGLDFAILGMGGDGHIASLFPGRDWSDGPSHAVRDSPKPPSDRVTLSLPTLASGVALVFALGAKKRPVIERVLRGDPTLPAAGLPLLTIVADRVSPAR